MTENYVLNKIDLVEMCLFFLLYISNIENKHFIIYLLHSTLPDISYA